MKLISCFCSMIILILSIIAQPVLAKTVNLYDQPNKDAREIGKIDLANGVIPIFKSQDQQWVKVGDPHNGNVGWIKSSDVDSSSSFSYTQKIINDKGQTEQTIQFGLLPTLTPKEREEMYKKIQIQQQKAREQMNNAMQNMLKEMNNYFQNFPLMLPGVVDSPYKGTQQLNKGKELNKGTSPQQPNAIQQNPVKVPPTKVEPTPTTKTEVTH